MPTPKPPNLLYHADCKEALQHLINQGIKVDLIYLDPPFNSHRNYHIVSKKDGVQDGVRKHQKAFSDLWPANPATKKSLTSFGEAMESSSELSELIKHFLVQWIRLLNEDQLNAEEQHMLVYLVYITERLLLMKRVLKETGSLYLHCDPTSSHYVKVVLDGVFGRAQFVNEIVWHYYSGGAGNKSFARKHDVILLYGKTQKYYFKRLKEKKYVKGKKPGKEPLKHAVREWLEDADGVYTTIHRRDTWYVPIINPRSKERWGYATQKPAELLNRIISASCPEGGLVLDPFCGSGTTLEQAFVGGRKWIGVDLGVAAIDLVRERLMTQGVFEGTDYRFVEASPKGALKVRVSED